MIFGVLNSEGETIDLKSAAQTAFQTLWCRGLDYFINCGRCEDHSILSNLRNCCRWRVLFLLIQMVRRINHSKSGEHQHCLASMFTLLYLKPTFGCTYSAIHITIKDFMPQQLELMLLAILIFVMTMGISLLQNLYAIDICDRCVTQVLTNYRTPSSTAVHSSVFNAKALTSKTGVTMSKYIS